MGVFNSKALEKLRINERETKKGYLEESDFIKQAAALKIYTGVSVWTFGKVT